MSISRATTVHVHNDLIRGVVQNVSIQESERHPGQASGVPTSRFCGISKKVVRREIGGYGNSVHGREGNEHRKRAGDVAGDDRVEPSEGEDGEDSDTEQSQALLRAFERELGAKSALWDVWGPMRQASHRRAVAEARACRAEIEFRRVKSRMDPAMDLAPSLSCPLLSPASFPMRSPAAFSGLLGSSPSSAPSTSTSPASSSSLTANRSPAHEITSRAHAPDQTPSSLRAPSSSQRAEPSVAGEAVGSTDGARNGEVAPVPREGTPGAREASGPDGAPVAGVGPWEREKSAVCDLARAPEWTRRTLAGPSEDQPPTAALAGADVREETSTEPATRGTGQDAPHPEAGPSPAEPSSHAGASLRLSVEAPVLGGTIPPVPSPPAHKEVPQPPPPPTSLPNKGLAGAQVRETALSIELSIHVDAMGPPAEGEGLQRGDRRGQGPGMPGVLTPTSALGDAASSSKIEASEKPDLTPAAPTPLPEVSDKSSLGNCAAAGPQNEQHSHQTTAATTGARAALPSSRAMVNNREIAEAVGSTHLPLIADACMPHPLLIHHILRTAGKPSVSTAPFTGTLAWTGWPGGRRFGTVKRARKKTQYTGPLAVSLEAVEGLEAGAENFVRRLLSRSVQTANLRLEGSEAEENGLVPLSSKHNGSHGNKEAAINNSEPPGRALSPVVAAPGADGVPVGVLEEGEGRMAAVRVAASPSASSGCSRSGKGGMEQHEERLAAAHPSKPPADDVKGSPEHENGVVDVANLGWGKKTATIIDATTLLQALRVPSQDPRDPLGRTFPSDTMLQELAASSSWST